jgi:F-type H+-transporting ATPase subunit epsilon
MADQTPDKVEFELISPMRVVHAASADMVVVPGGDGDFGVLPGHTPILTTVRPGVVDVYDGGAVAKKLFVEGGFAEATVEGCTVLATVAIPVEDIDGDHARTRLENARQALDGASADDMVAAEAELRIAEAMLHAVGGRADAG